MKGKILVTPRDFEKIGMAEIEKMRKIVREDKIDVVVDFSSTKAIEELKWALGKKILTLSGTTGYDDKTIDELSSLGGKYFYWTCNYAKGINLFSKLISIIKKEYELFYFL